MSEEREYWYIVTVTTKKGEVLTKIKTPYREFALEITSKIGKENFR